MFDWSIGYKRNIRLEGRLELHWGVKMESRLKMLANEMVCRQNRAKMSTP